MSDENGGYVLRMASLHDTRKIQILVAEHPDYLRELKPIELPTDLLTNRTIRRDIVMHSGLPVHFLVVDERSVPVEGVRVTLKTKSDGLDSRRYESLDVWAKSDRRSELLGSRTRCFEGISDAAGRLVIMAPKETLRLNAWKPGVIWHFDGIRDLAVQPDMDEVVVVVDTGASFRGQVVDATGAPVPSVTVFACGQNYRNPKKQFEISTTLTDEGGRFVLSGLRGDVPRCEILLTHAQFASTLYDKVELADGMILTIEGGANLELQLVDAFTGYPVVVEPELSFGRHGITIRSPNSAGRAVHSGLQHWTQESEGGRVRVGRVPRFAYAITVTCKGYDPETVLLDLDAKPAAQPIVVPLTPTWDMECVVVDSVTGKTIPGARLELHGNWEVDGVHRGTWSAEVMEPRIVDGEQRLYANSQWLKSEWRIFCYLSHPDYRPAPLTVIKPYGAPAPRHFRITLDPKE